MTPDSPHFFPNGLLAWYAQHKRDLPWRHTLDPYLIWLSEVILQQTRVAQGLPYFQRFAEAYPTVQHLAAAPEDEVLRLWQGLGYYSRARNMQHTARQLVQEFDGRFPGNYAALLQLKGIGTYTAAAIASFAFDEPVPVLDGNVYRVLARYFGLHNNIASPASKKVFQEQAQLAFPAENASLYNQAIMEFGALHCTPKNPACQTCPVQAGCYAFRTNLQQVLPIKEKQKKMRVRYFTYLVIHHQSEVYMRKRETKDIWQGLYDFPLLETETPLLSGGLFTAGAAAPQLSGGLFAADVLAPHLPPGAVLEQVSNEHRHQLSHQQVRAVFCRIRLAFPLTKVQEQELGARSFSVQEINQIGKPVMVARYLETVFF